MPNAIVLNVMAPHKDIYDHTKIIKLCFGGKINNSVFRAIGVFFTGVTDKKVELNTDLLKQRHKYYTENDGLIKTYMKLKGEI
jgi:hypothetical protein